MKPVWNSSKKSASIRKWADGLHKQAKEVFLKDKAHTHIIFWYKDDGPAGISPVPPKTNHAQINEAIRQAIEKNDLYGVIFVGEAWAYFPKEKDHTAFQLLDGEMNVSDLRPEDRTEALYLRMESRDRDCLIYLNRILRDGQNIELGGDRMVPEEDLKWF